MMRATAAQIEYLEKHDQAKGRLVELRSRPEHVLCAVDLEEFRQSLANVAKFCRYRAVQDDERFIQACWEQVDVESRIAFAMREGGENDLFTIESTLISVQMSKFIHLRSVEPLMNRWKMLRARLNSQRLDLMNKLGFKHRISSSELSQRRELGWRPSHVKCFRCGCVLVLLISPQCGCHPECDATGCILGTICDCQACRVWSQAQWFNWARLSSTAIRKAVEGRKIANNSCLSLDVPKMLNLAQVACELCGAVNVGEQFGARCSFCEGELPYSKRDFGNKRELYTFFWSTKSSTSDSFTAPLPKDDSKWSCELRLFNGSGIFRARQDCNNLDLECSFDYGLLSWKWRRPWTLVSSSPEDAVLLFRLLDVHDDLNVLSFSRNERILLRADATKIIRLREQIFSSEYPWLIVDFQPNIEQLVYCRDKLMVSLLWPENAQPQPNRAVIFETQALLGLFYSIEYSASRWNHLPRRVRVFGEASKLTSAISSLGLEYAVQVCTPQMPCDVRILSDPFSQLLTAENVTNWLEEQRPGTVLLACVLLYPGDFGNHCLGEITYNKAEDDKMNVFCRVKGLDAVYRVPRNAWLVRGDSFFSEKSGRLVMVKECARFSDMRVFRFHIALHASSQLGKPLALLGMLGAIERRNPSDQWLKAAGQMTCFVPQRLWRHDIIELFAMKQQHITSKLEAKLMLVRALDEKSAIVASLTSCARRIADYLGDTFAVMEGLPHLAHLFRDATSLERVRKSVFGELRVRFNVDMVQVLSRGNANYQEASEILSLRRAVDFILRRASDFPNSTLLCRHAAVSNIANLIQESPETRRTRFNQQVPVPPAFIENRPVDPWFMPILERDYVCGIGDLNETLALRNFCTQCPHFPNYAAAPEEALEIRRRQLAKFTLEFPTWEEACLELLWE